MVEKGLSDTERDMRSKLFESDVRNILMLSQLNILYLTSDQAIMFLPAEAIFAEINAYHTHL